MSMKKWLSKNGYSLKGKTVLITGATGGLGQAACSYILAAGGRLLMINRDLKKSQSLCLSLRKAYPQAEMEYLLADLQEISQVKALCEELQKRSVDIVILNAGTYAVPRKVCSTGYDVVFETNFLSHYYLVKQLLPQLISRRGKVVAVGSIAHNYIVTDPQDIDWSHHEGDSKIYGNSKRYLMYALMELLKNQPEVDFAIGHPGISCTGITSNYPAGILPFVKFSMKLLFMWPPMAVRSIVKAVFAEVPYLHWVGPKYFDIWGNPKVKPLNTCSQEERRAIFERAEKIYQKLI